MELEKLKVIKEKKVLEMLGISRQTFNRVYKDKKLITYKSENGYSTVYELSKVERLVEQKKLKDQKILMNDSYEIIK
jgi:predicted DNA-binding transcriptional regulator AlpA